MKIDVYFSLKIFIWNSTYTYGMVYSSTSVCLAKSTSHGLDHPSLSLIGPLRVPTSKCRNPFWDNERTFSSTKGEMFSCSLKLPSVVVYTEGINIFYYENYLYFTMKMAKKWKKRHKGKIREKSSLYRIFYKKVKNVVIFHFLLKNS